MSSGIYKSILNQPVDFTIKTPESLKQFLAELHQEKTAYTPSRALRLCLHFASKIQLGQMDVILPDQKKLRFLGDQPGPHGVLLIHNDVMARKFLTGGRLGFCESYLDGDWSSPDIAQFFELILRNSEIMRDALHGKPWYRWLSGFIHSLRPNSKRGSKKNIYDHYDIGNNFYDKWLDKTMTYSSALFRTGEESLEEAQQEKYAHLAQMLEINADHHVLEIGCGWGGFADYVASEIGAKMTCVTISQEQYDYAVKRMADKGLSDKVKILLKDYRDIDGQFDRIASIEMFEAVGEKYWRTYFNSLNRLLKPGGKAGLQVITIRDDHFEEYRKSADYIQRYIFPGGMLPSQKVLKKLTHKADLNWGNVFSFGKDYARTLSIWNQNFQQTWPSFDHKFDERFKRLWEQYLCYCQAGFSVGTIDVIQFTMNKK